MSIVIIVISVILSIVSLLAANFDWSIVTYILLGVIILGLIGYAIYNAKEENQPRSLFHTPK